MKKRIYVISGNAEGTRELIPVVAQLKKQEYKVTWVTDPEGVGVSDILSGSGISSSRDDDEVRSTARPDLILVGANTTTHGSQTRWSSLFKGRCPVVWYETFWGAGQCAHVLTETPPDALIVLDPIAESMARELRPNVNICIGGKPSYSKTLANAIENHAGIASSVREELSIPTGHCIITYEAGGDGVIHEEDVVKIICATVPRRSDLHVAFRFPPSIGHEDAQSLLALARKLLGEHALDTTSVTNPRDLMLASSVLITGGNRHIGVQAVLASTPVVLVPSSGGPDDFVNRGFPQGVPPLARAQACWSAREKCDLHVLIAGIVHAWHAAVEYTENARTPFTPLLEHGADSRIASTVEGLIS